MMSSSREQLIPDYDEEDKGDQILSNIAVYGSGPPSMSIDEQDFFGYNKRKKRKSCFTTRRTSHSFEDAITPSSATVSDQQSKSPIYNRSLEMIPWNNNQSKTS